MKLLDDNELKLWDDRNSFILFADYNSAMQKKDKIVGCSKNFMMKPPKLPHNIWERYAINTIGLANHSKGYYHSRINKGIYDLIITLSGRYSSRSDKHIYNADAGKCIILPPNIQLDSYVRAKTKVLWIHMYDIPYWRNLFGNEISIKCLNEFSELASLALAFKEEISKKKRSLAILEMIAECFMLVLRREFEKPASGIEDIRELLQNIKSNSYGAWNIKDIIKKYSINIREVNNLCRKYYAKSFSKILLDIKMKIALERIKAGGHTNLNIAKEIGYADGYSFSKAFNSYYKMSPKQAREEFTVKFQ